MPDLKQHLDTYMSLEALGSFNPPYQPTYAFSGDYINPQHEAIAMCPCKGQLIDYKEIDGRLRKEDALKLYELAYFAGGDIIEIGSFKGLSASIIGQAMIDSGNQGLLHSVDYSEDCINSTKETLLRLELDKKVVTFVGQALPFIKKMRKLKKRFSFAFIDHSHEYKSVYTVCRQLAFVLEQGAFCLFHDYNDSRNADASYKNYGVYQAVRDGLNHNSFQFYGAYGCAGLFRFVGKQRQGFGRFFR